MIARDVMVVKGAPKTSLTVSIGIAESGGCSGDVSVADMDEKVDSIFRAKAALSRGSAEIRDESDF